MHYINVLTYFNQTWYNEAGILSVLTHGYAKGMTSVLQKVQFLLPI